MRHLRLVTDEVARAPADRGRQARQPLAPLVYTTLRRIVRPYGYTCRLTRNHNNFVLDALARWDFIELRGDGWARPTLLGVFALDHYEQRGLL